MHRLIKSILGHVIVFWWQKPSSGYILIPIRHPAPLWRTLYLTVLYNLVVIPEAHIAIASSIIVLQLYGYSLILSEWISFLNILWHWMSSRGKYLRLCLRYLICAHLRSVQCLLVLKLRLLPSSVTREDCPVVVLSGPWDQNLSFFILLLMIIRCEFLIQTFEKLHLFLVFIFFIFNGC